MEATGGGWKKVKLIKSGTAPYKGAVSVSQVTKSP